MLIWTFVKRYLYSQRAGSTIRRVSRISMLTVFLSILALIVVMSVMNGFNSNMSQKLTAAEPHIVVYDSPENKSGIDEYLAKNNLYFYKFEQQDVLIRNLNGNFSGGVAKGLGKEAFVKLLTRIQRVLAQKDKSWQAKIVDLKPGEIVIGYDLARSLELFEGDEILLIPPENLLKPAGEAIEYEKVTIRYVLTTEITSIDSKYIFYIKGDTLNNINSSRGVDKGYEVVLEDPTQFKKNKAELLKLAPRVESWVDRNSSLFFALKMEKLTMHFFLCLSALIAGFSIFTMMALLITQKKKEIGMLQAIGFNNKQVTKLFSGIGLLSSVIGIFSACFLGAAICFILQIYPLEVLPDIYYDNELPVKFSWEQFFIVMFGSILFAFLASWLPVKLSLKKTPAELMRPR